MSPDQRQVYEDLRRDARASLGSLQAVSSRLDELLGGPPSTTTAQRKAVREAQFKALRDAGEGLVAMVESMLRRAENMPDISYAEAAIARWREVLK